MADDRSVTVGVLLERLGVGILVVWFMTRVFVVATPGDESGDPGGNLFIGLLAWIGGGAYIAGRGLTDGWVARWRGGLVALFVLAVAIAVSTLQKASYRLSAIEGSFAFVTAFLAFGLVVDQCGRGWRRLWIAAFFGVGAVAVLYALAQSVWLLPALQASGEAAGRGEEFAGRLSLGEPFGTFPLSNTFAGFLVLFLPLLAGRILDRAGGAGLREILLGALGLLSLYLFHRTGSRGGAVALAAAAAAMIALMAGRRRKWQPASVMQIGLIVAAAAGAAVALWGWKPLTERVETMAYRGHYWSAGRRMFESSPWLGVGVYQYGELYPQHRGTTTEETRQVHNDYLQFAAETGVFGFAAFAIFLLWLLGDGLRAMRPEETGARDPPATRGIVPGLALAGFAAFALSNLMAGAFDDVRIGGHPTPLLAAALLGVFIGAAALSGGGDGPMTRIGWAAGLVGYLVHALVDFDMFTFGFMACFFVLAAIGSAWGRVRELPVGRAPSLLLSIGLLLLALMLMLTRVPAWSTAQRGIEAAREAVDRARAAEGTLARLALLTEAADLIHAAAPQNPLDARIPALQCEIIWSLWRAKFEQENLTQQQVSDLETEVFEALGVAVLGASARPADAEMRFRIAYTQMLLAATLERLSSMPGVPADGIATARQQIAGHAGGAERGFGEAIGLDGMSARYHYWRARALFLQVLYNPQGPARIEEAQREYLRARAIAGEARLDRQREYWRPDAEDMLAGVMPGAPDE